jgi:hypothetical protein
LAAQMRRHAGIDPFEHVARRRLAAGMKGAVALGLVCDEPMWPDIERTIKELDERSVVQGTTKAYELKHTTAMTVSSTSASAWAWRSSVQVPRTIRCCFKRMTGSPKGQASDSVLGRYAEGSSEVEWAPTR